MFSKVKSFCGSCGNVLREAIGVEGDSSDGAVATGKIGLVLGGIALLVSPALLSAVITLGVVLLLFHGVRYLM